MPLSGGLGASRVWLREPCWDSNVKPVQRPAGWLFCTLQPSLQSWGAASARWTAQGQNFPAKGNPKIGGGEKHWRAQLSSERNHQMTSVTHSPRKLCKHYPDILIVWKSSTTFVDVYFFLSLFSVSLFKYLFFLKCSILRILHTTAFKERTILESEMKWNAACRLPFTVTDSRVTRVDATRRNTCLNFGICLKEHFKRTNVYTRAHTSQRVYLQHLINW